MTNVKRWHLLKHYDKRADAVVCPFYNRTNTILIKSAMAVLVPYDHPKGLRLSYDFSFQIIS